VGGAEIRVTGRDGIRYAAPDMIIHYVEAHGYRPPRASFKRCWRPAGSVSAMASMRA
jgi:hypothetical protein